MSYSKLLMNCSHSDTYLTSDGRRRCFDCREFLPDPEAVKPVMAAEPARVAPTVISAPPSPILLNTVTQRDLPDAVTARGVSICGHGAV